MGDLSEREILERLVDGARSAADRLQDVCRALAFGVAIEPKTLLDLRRHLKDASGSAHQLCHAQANPQFLALRDTLDSLATTVASAIMQRSDGAGLVLARLGAVLDRLWQEAQRMATGRAVSRQDALAMLDIRQKAVKV